MSNEKNVCEYGWFSCDSRVAMVDQTSSLVCNFKHSFIFVLWLNKIAALYVVNLSKHKQRTKLLLRR